MIEVTTVARRVVLIGALSVLTVSGLPARAQERLGTMGPLRVHPKNPRYFADATGRAIYLTGSHTWANLQDQGPKDPPKPFEYEGYLDFLREWNHNVIRLWAWEQARWAPWSDGKGQNPPDWFICPNPYARTGPGMALDGKPKFDLEKWDDAYFKRLRARVRIAAERGIYVSVMLFQGWSSAKSWLGGTPWRGHPYHPENNVQGWSGNTKGNTGPALDDPRVRARQAAYVRKVVDTLNDLDNVLYEVTNEGGYIDWDRFVVETVHAYEKTKPRQHPVGLTAHGSENNDEMLGSAADWFSPGSSQWPDLKTDPRAVDGKKVSLLDTDHVFGVGGDQKWVWKAFLRGHNVLFMDPYDDPAWAPILAAQGATVRDAEACRRAMGQTRRYAGRIDLAASRPASELASTGYCLAVPGQEYLVYLPDGGEAIVDLAMAKGGLSVEWIHPITGKTTSGEAVEGGGKRRLKAPFAGDAVVFVRAVQNGPGATGSAPRGNDRLGTRDERPNPPARTYFPPSESEGGWRKLDDADSIRRLAGMDPDRLKELRAWLRRSDDRQFAAVVIRRGYIVLQEERGNSAVTDSRRVASCSKAVCATVLAIASEQSRQGRTPRRMSFDDRAFDFIPWAQPLSDQRKAAITVTQLLNHTSGLCPEATGAPNDGRWEYILGHSGDARTERLAFEPGTACGYSTHALAHAALVCEAVTGKPYDEFAIEALFRPLGIEHWWFQYYDGGPKVGRHPSHGLGMPARALARIAYCMAHGGRWADRQVIPEWFVEQTAAPTHNVQGPELRFKLNSQVFSHGWELPARLTGEGGRSGRGIPPDARSKPGSGGQLIAFVPSLDLVVTRQTGSSGGWEYEEFLRRACAAVVEAPPEKPASAAPGGKLTAGTVLGVRDTRFTLGGEPAFLLGMSYYGALGAPEESVRRDLDDLTRHGFNWIRVWATWSAFGRDVSAVDAGGGPREPFLGRLERLVAECDRRGLIVDVTLTRGDARNGGAIPDFAAHRRAVATLVGALKAHRNWYIDLANERDVRDPRHVPADELTALREQVRKLDPERLVTASFGGHDLDEADIREAILTIGLDFVAPHRPRDAGSAGQTEARTRAALTTMRAIGRSVPVHYQEPFRRGYDLWQPTDGDFLTDLRGAVAGGAAGWCLHNGSTRGASEERPRRSFDLHDQRLFDQLDAEEGQVVARASAETHRAARRAELEFRHHFVSLDLPSVRGQGDYGLTALADLDRDGDLDFVCGGRIPRPERLYWFEYRGPDDWVRHDVGVDYQSDVGLAPLDVDGDGWVDLVCSGVWYRNPGNPREAPFERIAFAGSAAGAHDILVADVDQDGRADIVMMGDSRTALNALCWFSIPTDPRGPWARHAIGPGIHGAITPGGAFDIDGDSDLDIARGDTWYENRDGKGLGWQPHRNLPMGRSGPYGVCVRSAVADLDGDGRPELVVADADIAESRVAVLWNRGGKGTDWRKQELPQSFRYGSLHALAVADLSGDGRPDIVVNEQEELLPAGRDNPRWVVWENLGIGGFAERVVLDRRLGGHELQAGDVDGDGDIDIVSKPWSAAAGNGAGGKMHVDYLENRAKR